MGAQGPGHFHCHPSYYSACRQASASLSDIRTNTPWRCFPTHRQHSGVALEVQGVWQGHHKGMQDVGAVGVEHALRTRAEGGGFPGS